MSQIEKLIEKFQGTPPPKDFTWDELLKLLRYFGFNELSTGKTGGSRRKFIDKNSIIISLHKPHPQTELKAYQIAQILEKLQDRGTL